MLSCRDVAKRASDYLDERDSPKGQPSLQIRLHLMLCSNCRRFVRHMHSARQLAALVQRGRERSEQGDEVLSHIKRQDAAPPPP
ncbi:hypothetical protein [uncultured Gilvimarinus sp.]|jgi:predicted anti-sigma-YlaC factor YlaD|uniref:hypothetical protein n=1 Tax=uncultured Gilvimarinus sp. TaxID=1689143 RepID=UPI0030D83F9A